MTAPHKINMPPCPSTRFVNLLKNGTANPLVLLAAAYMLAASLPKKIINMARYWIGYEDLKVGDAAASATADAGDDAVEATVREGEGEGDDCDCDCEDEGHDEADAEHCDPAEGPALLTGDQAADAAVRASRLLARAVAAKEASGKAMTAPKEAKTFEPVPEEEDVEDKSNELSLGGLRAAARLRAQRDARRRSRDRSAAQEDDAADDDDGGGHD